LNIKTRAQANDIVHAKKLKDVDMIFLAGGDQLRLSSILGGSRVLDAILNRLESGVLLSEPALEWPYFPIQ